MSTRSVRGVPAATRRPRVPRPVGLLALALLAVFAYVGFTASAQSGDDAVVASIPALPPAVEGDANGYAVDSPRRGLTADRADRTSRDPDGAAPNLDATAEAETFASVEGLELGLPHDDVVLVAFHEASLREALELSPVGRLDGNDNPTKFMGSHDGDGPAYRVLSSRGRPRPATSAVDIVLPKGSTVVAPVSGRVVEARDYALYGSTRDWRVVIEPHDRPDLHVVLIHLHRPAVTVGDEVTVGHTPLAVARQLSFSSQVDYVLDDHLPHVHIEVKAATAPKPVDPNASAVDPDETADVEPVG